MASYVTPEKNAQFIFYVGLTSQADTKLFQVNPTLAAGDVKVTTDGGAAANITTLPTVTPAGGTDVKVTLSASEMNGDNISVTFSDAAGAEWCDLKVTIQTSVRQIDDLSTLTTSDVNGEVLDVLNVDTFAAPGQGTPPSTTTLSLMLRYLYKFLRNRTTQTATTQSVYNDDATTVDHKATVSDDGTTFDRGEFASGP